MTFAEGQFLGNYRISARIGSGGMGEVYLAAHPLIGKKVALKVIHRDLAASPEVVARFFNEARAVNQVGSEHIVEIHDFGQTPQGDHFFIMEYLEGRTLADELTQMGRVDVARALHIGAQIAAGLGAAHQHNIIHRDLKPDNIMLISKRGDPDFVKVLDFGLAKVLADGAPQLTGVGVMLGTPQFMSPEAVECRKDIDHRCDIYSLGILLFQMLTGRVPFDSPVTGEVLVKQVSHPPPALRAFNPDVPPAVEQIVLRCLAKTPDARFQSMAEIRAALLAPEQYLAGAPPVMPAMAVSNDTGARSLAVPHNETMVMGYDGGPRRWPILLVVLLIAAGAGAVVAAVAGPADDRPAERAGSVVDAGAGRKVAALAQDAGAGAQPAASDAAVAAADGAPADVATMAPVKVSSRPSGALVVGEDGQELGETPVTLELPAGVEHRLRLSRPGRRDKVVVVVPGEEKEVMVRLVRRRAGGTSGGSGSTGSGLMPFD